MFKEICVPYVYNPVEQEAMVGQSHAHVNWPETFNQAPGTQAILTVEPCQTILSPLT